MGYYTWEADCWCENCLPVDSNSEDVGYGDGESDSPVHCCACHTPQDYSLTSEGVNYVLEAIAEMNQELEKLTPEEKEKPTYFDENPNYYYARGPRYTVVQDWAEHVKDYGQLTDEQQNTIDKFFDLIS